MIILTQFTRDFAIGAVAGILKLDVDYIIDIYGSFIDEIDMTLDDIYIKDMYDSLKEVGIELIEVPNYDN